MKRAGTNGKVSSKGNPESWNFDDVESFQGRGFHGNQADMDIYSEQEGYFGISPFYGDLPEEKVDTEEIDKEFSQRYDQLLSTAKRLLTPDQYRIFEMYFVNCQSQETVARSLNVSQPHVSQTCNRILEILREHEGEVL